MNEEVTLAQLKRMRQEAFNRGNIQELERLKLCIAMKEGTYPENRTHKRRHGYDTNNP